MQHQPQDIPGDPAPLQARNPTVPADVPPPAASPGQQPRLPLGNTKRRLILAFAIAGVSDLISAFMSFIPAVGWAVDFVTAVLLFIVLGWHWLLLPGLIMEAIPGVGVVPFWVLVVGAIAVWGTVKPKLN